MDEPRDYHTKCNESNRERQISHDITYMWNLKNMIKRAYLQNRERFTVIGNKVMIIKGEKGRKKDKLGIWD